MADDDNDDFDARTVYDGVGRYHFQSVSDPVQAREVLSPGTATDDERSR